MQRTPGKFPEGAGRYIESTNVNPVLASLTNRSSQTLVVTIDQIQVGDDFSPGQIESTCTLGDTLLPAGESCTHVIGFRPSLFFAGRETAFLNVTARDAWGILLFERTVKLSGTGFAD